MRILLDTNVLVAALITKDSPPDLLYQAWQRGEITMTNLDIYLKQTGHFSIFRKECHTLRVS